jgi:hypothetical protein
MLPPPFDQHCGIMVCLMGVFMSGAAMKESWRVPILLYSLIEKAFMDTIIVLYSILYFWSRREKG